MNYHLVVLIDAPLLMAEVVVFQRDDELVFWLRGRLESSMLRLMNPLGKMKVVVSLLSFLPRFRIKFGGLVDVRIAGHKLVEAVHSRALVSGGFVLLRV